jgi:hypothetical protein
MSEQIVSLLPAIIAGVVAIVAFFGGWALMRGKLGGLFDWLAQQTRIKKLSELDEMLVGFAMDLYQAEIKELKEASADGKLSKEDADRMMRILVAKAKQHFGADFFKGFVASAGLDAMDAFIRSRGERAVVQAKGIGAEVAATKSAAAVTAKAAEQGNG